MGWDQEDGPEGLCSRFRTEPPSLPCRYAEVVVASENSVHKLLELLPGKILNGDKVEVRLATRQNLSQFEAQARKRECGTGVTRAGGFQLTHIPVPPWISCQAQPSEPSGWGETLPGASGGCFSSS